MITKVKFKALTQSGKTVFFTEKIETPDFKPTPARVFAGQQLREIPASAKVIDWLDEQDKTDMMDRRDLRIIFDYWIPQKSHKTGVVDLLKSLDLDDETIVNLGAIHDEIGHLLRGKAPVEQVKMLISHYRVAIKAKNATFRHILDFSESIKIEIEERAERKEIEGKIINFLPHQPK